MQQDSSLSEAAGPKLLVAHEKATSRLQAQIERGNGIVNRPITTDAEIDQTRADLHVWSNYNVQLLGRLFDGHEVVEFYKSSIPNRVFDLLLAPKASLINRLSWFRDDAHSQIIALETLLDQLELHAEFPDTRNPTHLQAGNKQRSGDAAGVVAGQGHDSGASESEDNSMPDLPKLRKPSTQAELLLKIRIDLGRHIHGRTVNLRVGESAIAIVDDYRKWTKH